MSSREQILFVLAATLALSGCGGAVQKNGDDAGGAARSSVNAPSPAPNSVAEASATPASVSASPNSTTANGVGGAQQGATQVTSSRGASSPPPTKMPTPQIGPGGNDFFLFTQVRAAVNADPELKAANITLDVKDGVVTLSGVVASAAQKSKAEQLVRGAGPKDVRNQLRVNGK